MSISDRWLLTTDPWPASKSPSIARLYLAGLQEHGSCAAVDYALLCFSMLSYCLFVGFVRNLQTPIYVFCHMLQVHNMNLTNLPTPMNMVVEVSWVCFPIKCWGDTPRYSFYLLCNVSYNSNECVDVCNPSRLTSTAMKALIKLSMRRKHLAEPSH